MLFSEYLTSNNQYDTIRIDAYSKYIDILDKSSNKYNRIKISEDYLEHHNICEEFSKYKNAILLISSGDIDFPPPKKPYSYSKYFNEYILPSNYKTLDYYTKINMDILPIIENNNMYVVSQDVSIDHPRIINMPIGAFHKFNHQHYKRNTKLQLCYANFSIPWNPYWFGDIRQQIFNIIKNKQFIRFDNVKLSNARNTDNIESFYENISKSKFAICPRGCGIDTYRLWDCLYLGCIPIVERYNGHREFDDLPILFINSIKEYSSLTSEYLESIYTEMLNTKYNFDKLNFSYWKNRIEMLSNL